MILPGASSPLPNVYAFSTKIGKILENPSQTIRSFGDLESGNIFFYNNGVSEEGWHSGKGGLSAITDYAYIYKNKAIIEKRPPHILQGLETQLPDSSFPADIDGWRFAFNDWDGIGIIKTDSIQVTSPNDNSYPSIRFIAQINSPFKNNTPMVRMLVEVDPNSFPHQFQVVWLQRLDPEDNNTWVALSTVRGLRSINTFDSIDELAAAAYGYAIMHSEEVESRGYFTFGEKVEPPK